MFLFFQDNVFAECFYRSLQLVFTFKGMNILNFRIEFKQMSEFKIGVYSKGSLK